MIWAAACAPSVRSSGTDAAPPIALAWPEPPLTPRIRYLRSLAGEIDLDRKTTFGENMKRFVSGEKPAVSKLYQPRDVVVSDDGNRVYVSDYAQLLVFKFDLEHNRITHIGKEKPFARPFGVALDADENLYVVEQQAARISVLNRDGLLVRTIQHPSLVRPTDAAIDRRRGLLYVADPATKTSPQHTVKVFSLEGALLRTVGSGVGDCDGCLYFPTFLATDATGHVYVSSTLNARVDVFDSLGVYERTIGGRGTSFGMFDKPKGVALDSFGNLYVADSGWSNVQIFNDRGEVLLFFGGRGVHPGLLRNPAGIFIDQRNTIYVADYLNYRITMYELVNTTAEDSHPAPLSQEPRAGSSHGG
jgi:DNA-binding beta-propeller fold protein YncE